MQSMKKGQLNQRGFSLVELMVVVAIIGVLATIAIPRVNRFIAKSRTSEAQVNLSSIYTFNKNFFVEFQGYTNELYAMGYLPEGQLRYNVGWSVGVQTPANYTTLRGIAQGQTPPPTLPAGSGNYGPAGAVNSLAACPVRALANQPCATLNGNTGAAPPAIPAQFNSIAANAFTAGAIAQLSGNANVQDTWTINDAKVLINRVDGTQ